MKIPNHENLIDCFQALYPTTTTKNGLCFGIAHMARQAFLAEDMEHFYARLKRIQSELLPIVQKAMDDVSRSGIDKTNDVELFFRLVHGKVEKKISVESVKCCKFEMAA